MSCTVNIENAAKNLTRRGFEVHFFETAGEAADYLVSSLHGRTIGIGGSSTVAALGIEEALKKDNELYWHWNYTGDEMQRVLKLAYNAEVYMMSANGIAETGEIVNIDGRGNRLAGSLFGHEKLYIVVGVNKFAATLEDAIYRARNVAAPKNAKRLERKTPCAVNGDRCYDCQSPDRICNALNIIWNKPGGIGSAEVIIINEELGY